ncbi:MAG: hypothetical protein ACOQNY_01770 [Mycoplasmoidaceae bacterium]
METQFTNKTYTKTQVSLLTKSMLISGIAFVIIGLLSFGWAHMFNNANMATNISMGLPIFLLTLFTGVIVSMLWTKNMVGNGSLGLTLLCYGVYILSTSLAFGWLFALGFEADYGWLWAMFLVVGGIFLLATLIAKTASIKSIMTMGKIIGIVGVTMFVFFFAFLIMMIISLAMHNMGAMDWVCSLIMMGMAVITFLYIVIDIWQISKISEFSSVTDVSYKSIWTWFVGFRLLTDLVNLLFIVFIFFLRFARR